MKGNVREDLVLVHNDSGLLQVASSLKEGDCLELYVDHNCHRLGIPENDAQSQPFVHVQSNVTSLHEVPVIDPGERDNGSELSDDNDIDDGLPQQTFDNIIVHISIMIDDEDDELQQSRKKVKSARRACRGKRAMKKHKGLVQMQREHMIGLGLVKMNQVIFLIKKMRWKMMMYMIVGMMVRMRRVVYIMIVMN